MSTNFEYEINETKKANSASLSRIKAVNEVLIAQNIPGFDL